MFNGKQVDEIMNDKAAGFKWPQLQAGGILIVNRTNSDEVIITE